MDLYKCDVCEMVFRDIGKLSEKEFSITRRQTTGQSARIVVNNLFQTVMWQFTNIKLMTLFVSDATQHAKETAWRQLHMKLNKQERE